MYHLFLKSVYGLESGAAIALAIKKRITVYGIDGCKTAIVFCFSVV